MTGPTAPPSPWPRPWRWTCSGTCSTLSGRRPSDRGSVVVWSWSAGSPRTGPSPPTSPSSSSSHWTRRSYTVRRSLLFRQEYCFIVIAIPAVSHSVTPCDVIFILYIIWNIFKLYKFIWLDLIQWKTSWIFQLKTIKRHFYLQLENF